MTRYTRITLGFLAASCLLGLAVEGLKNAPSHLKIVTTKRVNNCSRRSKQGDSLSMHYTGTLFSDGTKFDSSIPRGEPLVFTLGIGQVIKGWDQGLSNMCVGEKRKLVIPPELAYGAQGAPPQIPADATLVFDVELIDIIDEGK
ncbi:FK506-binding protein 2A [Basidiobolus ranarum]|uniref:peptidylprolyl isomerase n=1 Tax=Basidiobolus ranarum TaxID=34480 RepID=A0ABR2W4L8_9FUNG